TERYRLQFRADLINAFNHAQYTPGSPNSVTPISTTGVSNVNTAGSGQFNRPDQVFSSNPRLVQLSARFTF
ncbi:MAG TPA: hypothetical protein VEF04_03560, partial [Blastocatellia bacterium]|nr:hypothetical protein [Blastocatellia bacterium]